MVLTIIYFKHKIRMFIYTCHLVPQRKKISRNFCLVQLVPEKNQAIKGTAETLETNEKVVLKKSNSLMAKIMAKMRWILNKGILKNNWK